VLPNMRRRIDSPREEAIGGVAIVILLQETRLPVFTALVRHSCRQSDYLRTRLKRVENGGMGFVQRSAWAAVLLCASAIAMPQLSEKPRITSQPEMRVDLNSASMEELLQVPGMTRTWASRIVRFRPYHAKNELLDRGIVTSEVYSRIREYVVAHRNK